MALDPAIATQTASLQAQEDDAFKGKNALLGAEPARVGAQSTENATAQAELSRREADAAGVKRGAP